MASSFVKSARYLSAVPSRTTSYPPFRRKRITSLTKTFSTSIRRQEELQSFRAAPEINFNNPVFNHELNLLERIRVVPKSPSYFSAKSIFNDVYLNVEELWLKYNALPKMEAPPEITWISHEDMKKRIPLETVGKTKFDRMIERLKELSAIESILMPPEVTQAMQAHMTAVQIYQRKRKEYTLDEWGRGSGIGKRKTSRAKAYLVMGEGEVIINGRNIAEHFGRLHHRESALWPLKITERMDKYNVFAVVHGGGVTGQAEAMTLAVANALLVHEPELEERLRDTGCLYRDPRKVERKKPGHRKARKMPQWVKR